MYLLKNAWIAVLTEKKYWLVDLKKKGFYFANNPTFSQKKLNIFNMTDDFKKKIGIPEKVVYSICRGLKKYTSSVIWFLIYSHTNLWLKIP